MNFLQQLLEMTKESFARARMIFRSTFPRRGIELVLTSHSADRSIEGDRGRDVTEEYLIQAMESFLHNWDHKEQTLERIKHRARDEHRGVRFTMRRAVDDTFINIAVLLEWLGGNKYRLTVLTIMVKRDFKPYANDIMVDL